MVDGATMSSRDMDSESPRSGSPAPSSKLSSKSYESLTSHPLLGEHDSETDAVPTTAKLDTAPAATEPITSQPIPYAVTYRTRQRPVSTASLSQASLGVFSQPSSAAAATTTSASATSPLPTSPSSPSSLTNKLHSQNLQASAQEAGLTVDSAGWHLLQKIVNGAEKENEKDKGLTTALKALRTGKAIMLLPCEQATLGDINSSFLRDHILLKDGRNVTTLSGLRGVMADDVITFTSCVPPIDMKKPPTSEAAFTELLNPGTPAISDGHIFPSRRIGKPVNVHIARQSPVPAKQAKPATKPRSLVNLFGGQRSVSTSSIASTSGALPRSDEAPAMAPNPLVGTPVANGTHATMPIPAWTVDSTLHSKPIAKAISASVATRLSTALDVGDDQLNGMVLDFVKRFHPSSRTPIQPTSLPMEPNSNLDDVDLANTDITTVTAAIQEFYHDARQRMEAANRERSALAEALSDDGEKTSKDVRHSLIDVDRTLEQVEEFLCETLYDKLFAPTTSTDRQDDESLSMRIAGLHMLDLTLDHLGIQTDLVTGDPEADDVQRTVRDGLEEIISLCGKELQKLQYSNCRTPLAKLKVLISVHKIIADCLEVLPPITMTDDSYRRESVSPPVSGQVIEMSADAKSLGGRSAPGTSRTASEASDMEKTPRISASISASTSDQQPPAIRLHDSSFTEPYQLSTPSEYIAEAVEPFTGSELETKDAPIRATPAKTRSHNTTSADAILPLLIYAVVQANPVRLVSHVMFVQRFRADSLMAGEGEYCLCNMEAVRSFLMSCDVASLGLGAGKLMSASDLPAPPVRIRQRPGQHLDNMVGTAVGSAGRVLGQAADIGLGGYRILGGLLARAPASMDNSQQPQTLEDVQSVLAGGTAKASSTIRQAILRRGTNTSLVSARTVDSRISKETEMSDVKALGTSPRQDASRANQPLSSSATISSRLASLPGLSRLSAPPATTSESGQSTSMVNEQSSTSPGLVSGFMASMPSMPRPFADSSVKTSVEGVQSADVNRGTLATSGMEGADQSRPSTISIMPAAYVASAGQEVSTPLLSPTPFPNAAQVSESSTNVGQSNDPLPTDRLRSSSFMSHPHQYEALKASNRPRSGSAASNSSGSAMGLPISRGGVAGAFGAVTNLVSNVRHAYSPSISSQTSNAPKASDAPIQRFLDCEVDDLKMSEVALLLADYKRLAARLNEST